MKRNILALLLAALLLAGCGPQKAAPIPTAITTLPPETQPTGTETEAQPVAEETTLPETVPTTVATEPPIVVELTEEEQEMLLKLGMAELGRDGCRECVALVMCTVLNRVNSGRFSSSVKGVILAVDQFTPVSDGTYDSAEPNDLCHEALDMVMRGWDESQGALYYEFCVGESWHSKNLELLFEHCFTRFYK